MNNFKAIGYHGTDNETLEINFALPKNDVFLGRGFYIWRDSYERAKTWKNSLYVYEVEVSCSKDEMLNFTSVNWNQELDIMKLYLKYFKPKKIYFGEFIDFLIDEMDVDIKLVTIMDLKNKPTKIHIQDPYKNKNKTIFSYGDIQICIKDNSVLAKDIQKVTYES